MTLPGKTTTAGIGAILTGLLALVHCYSGGHLDWMCFLAGLSAIFSGGGLVAAKNATDTGGTVPVTVEALARTTPNASAPVVA